MLGAHSDDLLQALVDLIYERKDGLGTDAIHQFLARDVPRRTLQRRLAGLVEQGRLRVQGKGRSVRYLYVPQHLQPPQHTTQISLGEPVASGYTTEREIYVRTSREGEEVKAYVRQPRQMRQPIGYRLAFLEQYLPNQTAYLPIELRKQLHMMGRSPAAQNPAGTFARNILNRLLIDLSWASSQLEGNTYSRLDTERLIAFGQAAEGKNALETQMILNHKNAIEYLVCTPGQISLNEDTVIALHAFLSDGLMSDPLSSGRIRNCAVEIGGSVYLPMAFPQQVQELFGVVLRMATEIVDPFEQAFFLMVHLPYLQPFEDINKRVSRLAANIPFINHNLCPLSFIDVPQQAYVDAMIGVYELNRIELLRDVFVWAYERSCQQYVAVKQNLVEPDMFRLRYRQALSEVIATIVRQFEPATDRVIRQRIPAEVREVDQDHFIELVLKEFTSLHSGNVIRFGIRPLEFSAWQERQTKQS